MGTRRISRRLHAVIEIIGHGKTVLYHVVHMYYGDFTATVQVRLTADLEKLISAAVKKGFYANKSEFIRDAIRERFEPELRDEVLAELAKRSKSKKFVSHEAIMQEFGLA